MLPLGWMITKTLNETFEWTVTDPVTAEPLTCGKDCGQLPSIPIRNFGKESFFLSLRQHRVAEGPIVVTMGWDYVSVEMYHYRALCLSPRWTQTETYPSATLSTTNITRDWPGRETVSPRLEAGEWPAKLWHGSAETFNKALFRTLKGQLIIKTYRDGHRLVPNWIHTRTLTVGTQCANLLGNNINVHSKVGMLIVYISQK